MQKTVKTQAATITYDPYDSIIRIDYVDNHIITKQDAQEIINTALILVNGRPFGVISILKNNPINSEAQEILRKASPNLVALGAVIKNKFLRQAFNFFLLWKSIEYQFQIFDDEGQARQWVKERLIQYLTGE